MLGINRVKHSRSNNDYVEIEYRANMKSGGRPSSIAKEGGWRKIEVEKIPYGTRNLEPRPEGDRRIKKGSREIL